MTQDNIDKVKTSLYFFAGLLGLVGIGLLIWSFTRPPVTDGPAPPLPEPLFGTSVRISDAGESSASDALPGGDALVASPRD